MHTTHPSDITIYELANADTIIGIDEDILYMQRYSDIFAVDVSNLKNIQQSQIHLDAIDPLEMTVTKHTAYFISQTGDSANPLALNIADLETSSDATFVAAQSLPFTGKTDRSVSVYPKALTVKNDKVYVALLSGELLIFDDSISNSPKFLKSLDYEIIDPIGVPEIKFRDMQIFEDQAFIGCSRGLVILNIQTEQGKVVLNGPVTGLNYNTPSLQKTTDTDGTFSYQPNEMVTFSIGGTILGTTPGKAVITPVDLVPGATDETHPIVTNMARLLLTLDRDCNPANGILISKAVQEEMKGRNLDFSADERTFETETDFILSVMNGRNLFTCGEVQLWPAESARRHLRTTLKRKPQFKLTIKEGQHCSVTIDPYKDFYNEGEAVRLTLVPESGWKFKNWLGDASPYENPTTVNMNSDRTIVAIPETMIPESFQVPMVLRITESGSGTVFANPPGGTYHVDPHAYINKNQIVSLTAKPAPGWVFDQWQGDITSRENPETIEIDGYKNITAVFSPLLTNQYTLHTEYKGMGGIQLDPPENFYYRGVPVTVTAIADDGWIFAEWTGDISGNEISKVLDMDSNYQITAEFIELPAESYTLTAQTDRGTVVNFWPPEELIIAGSVVSASYKAQTEVTVRAVPRPGYVFVEWGGDLSGSQNPQFLLMDGDKTVMLLSEPVSP